MLAMSPSSSFDGQNTSLWSITMLWRAHRILLPLLMILLSAGCLSHQRKHDVVRFWFDYNTLSAPALFLEQHDHKPYRSSRVGYFAWMYGQDPGHQSKYVKARKDWEKLVDERMEQAGQYADSAYKAQIARQNAEKNRAGTDVVGENTVPPAPDGSDAVPSLGPEGSPPTDVPPPDRSGSRPSAQTVPTSLQLPMRRAQASAPTTVLSVDPQPRSGPTPSQSRAFAAEPGPSRPIGQSTVSRHRPQRAGQPGDEYDSAPLPTTAVASQPRQQRQPVAVNAPLPLAGPAGGWMPQAVPVPQGGSQVTAPQTSVARNSLPAALESPTADPQSSQADPNRVAMSPRATLAPPIMPTPRQELAGTRPHDERLPSSEPYQPAPESDDTLPPPESTDEMASDDPDEYADEYVDDYEYSDAEDEEPSAEQYAAIPDSLMDLPPLDEPAEESLDDPIGFGPDQPEAESESRSRLPEWTSVPRRPFDFLPENKSNDATRLKFRRLTEQRRENMWDRAGQRYSAGIAAGWQSLDW